MILTAEVAESAEYLKPPSTKQTLCVHLGSPAVLDSASSGYRVDLGWRRPACARPPTPAPCQDLNLTWAQLLSIAQAEVAETIAALPAPLRAQAAPLPVTFERKPSAALVAEGSDPDLLGLFIGAAMDEPMDSPMPPQIILFLENLWEFAESDDEIYREEIQITYLHELGHYLGLDEIDLEERGLE